MKKWLCILLGMSVITACEQKETTVTNPPEEKTEKNTTVIKESPAPEKKTESTETKTETNINVNPSPSPSP